MTGYQVPGCNGVGAWYHQLAKVGLLTCPNSPIPAGFRSGPYWGIGCSGHGGFYLARA
ncbi:hypothetical protein [Kitasatospora sp. NPDC093806]|uniref:hypothetical protein n=1 Tax=Kitasatospora sp. NPDC093806 TaxID=3155075 RepID=UPI0034295B7E